MFDEEIKHNLTLSALNIYQKLPFSLNSRFEHPKLKTDLARISLDNPLIVGAGFDKPAQAIKALHQLGFGAVEVGTVSFQPQDGNSKPRLFQLKSGVFLNSFGFNNAGVEVLKNNLQQYQDLKIPIGVNIGINKGTKPQNAAEMYAKTAQILSPLAFYLTINVSSPNTPNLRKLQHKKYLDQIIKEVKKVTKKPLFIKNAPDLTFKQLDSLLEVCLQNKITGIVATNTSNNPKFKTKYGSDRPGGISGNDLDYIRLSNKIISYLYEKSHKKLTIIGGGGVHDLESALDKFYSGATAIQIVSALYAGDLNIANKINRQLVAWMKKHQVKNLAEISG